MNIGVGELRFLCGYTSSRESLLNEEEEGPV